METADLQNNAVAIFFRPMVNFSICIAAMIIALGVVAVSCNGGGRQQQQAINAAASVQKTMTEMLDTAEIAPIVTQLPETSAQPNQAVVEEGVNYTVRAGDTFSSISRKFGVNIDKIRQLNSLKSNSRLIVGQKLKYN